MSPLARRLLLGAALLAAVPLGARGGLEAFRGSRHADPRQGAFRDPKYRAGTCLQCHGTPAAGAQPGQNRMALFAADDNGLCFECHKVPAGRMPEPRRYALSTHGSSSQVVWPGPRPKARPVRDGGLCLNCHDVHGSRDGRGQVPAMLHLRGDDLCLACHRAAGVGPDVGTDLGKIHAHPRPGVAGSPGPGCADCHNPHVARRDPMASAGAPSGLLDGVARVRPVNGPAGSTPALQAIGPEDANPVREYEVCFRCHAGKADAPAATSIPKAPALLAGRVEVASDFNPANASFHPVESRGRDLGIDPASFASGWSGDRMVTCSDCHGSDGGRVRGPHGSSLPGMLKKRYVASSQPDRVQETDLCFDCHGWATYGAGGAAGLAWKATRYDGHAPHAARGYSCHACHAPHGSAAQPSLLALRTPGILSFTRDAFGGTCTVSCHTRTPPTTTYRLRYSR